jgi:hypothetical protein
MPTDTVVKLDQLLAGAPLGASGRAPTPQAVAQAAEWQFMVRSLYLAAGSPPVAGFTESQVDKILWGELPADPSFFAALLRVLTRPPRDKRGELEPSAATSDSVTRVYVPRFVPQGSSTSQGTRYVQPLGRTPVAGMPTEVSRGFTPPNPDAFTTVADFVRGMQDLRAWAKLSLRELQERARKPARGAEPAVWLPRSTLSDNLRRDKLPKRGVVQAYVAACGLPESAQSPWLDAYERLTNPHRLHDQQLAARVIKAMAAARIPPNLLKLANELGISPALMHDTIEALGGFNALWNRMRQDEHAETNVEFYTN